VLLEVNMPLGRKWYWQVIPPSALVCDHRRFGNRSAQLIDYQKVHSERMSHIRR
jgi:hypothetical protein